MYIALSCEDLLKEIMNWLSSNLLSINYNANYSQLKLKTKAVITKTILIKPI